VRDAGLGPVIAGPWLTPARRMMRKMWPILYKIGKILRMFSIF
jgi:hypothetical protein